MKHRDLEKKLRNGKAIFIRSGGNHEIYEGPNGKRAAVPRHKEVDNRTAAKILETLGIE